MSNAKAYYGKIPFGEGTPKIENIVDDLTTTDPEKALSANQGYVLSQKFMKDVKVTTNNKLIITYFNGNTFEYDLTSFLNSVISSIGYGKCIYCDELPTCASYIDAFGNTQYEITYVKDSVSSKCDAKNTWFYYEVVADKDTGTKKWVQTLFVDGKEVTLEAGTISDFVKIDKDTKHWLISGKDSGVVAQGISPKITPNANNTDTIYKLDVEYYDPYEPTVDESGNPVYEDDGVTQKVGMDIKYTTDNLRGADGVMVQNAGMFGIRVENNQLMLYVNVPDSSSTDVDDQAPPFSIENNCLMYTVNGKIQYVSKQIIS